MKRKLVLQNGLELIGHGFGSEKEVIAELVFNTSVVGYQEILSDPAYNNQMLCMTYTLIGNYGMIDEDYDSKIMGPKALVVREYNDKPSNFRYTKTLREVLEENDVVGITHVDTRELMRIVRKEGTMLAIICDLDVTKEEALEKIQAYQVEKNLVSQVSCAKVWYSRCPNPKYNVVAIDCGIQYSQIRELNQLRCNVIIVPAKTSADKILAMNPDGIFVSSGPGNPEEAQEVIELVKQLQGKKPMFGVGLGCLIMALANGCKTEKMSFGHHGSNYPVRNVKTNKVEVTAQNHIYVINELSECVETSYVNVLDESIEGIEIKGISSFASLFIPQNCLGVSHELFQKFIACIDEEKGGK